MKKIMLVLLLLGIFSVIAETYRWQENGKTVQWTCSGSNCVRLE